MDLLRCLVYKLKKLLGGGGKKTPREGFMHGTHIKIDQWPHKFNPKLENNADILDFQR